MAVVLTIPWAAQSEYVCDESQRHLLFQYKRLKSRLLILELSTGKLCSLRRVIVICSLVYVVSWDSGTLECPSKSSNCWFGRRSLSRWLVFRNSRIASPLKSKCCCCTADYGYANFCGHARRWCWWDLLNDEIYWTPRGRSSRVTL